MSKIKVFSTLESLLSPQKISLLQNASVPVFIGESIVVKGMNLLKLLLTGFFDVPEKILERHSYTDLACGSVRELWPIRDKHIERPSQYINLVVRHEVNLMDKNKEFPALLHIVQSFPYHDRRYDEVVEVSFTKNNIQFGFDSVEYLFFKGNFLQFKQELQKMIKKHTIVYAPPDEEIEEVHNNVNILKQDIDKGGCY